MPSGPPKICKVCSDKANGYNFNAITCESCKAFFRRNANKSEVLQCSFQGNCNIEVKTRRFCQKCRLDKCFQVGMKREWILSDEQKQQKRAKILENKKKKASVGFRQPDSSEPFASKHEESSTTTRSFDMDADSPLLEGSTGMEELADFLDPDRALLSALNVQMDGDLASDLNIMEQVAPSPVSPSSVAGLSLNTEVATLSEARIARVHQRVLETNFTPIFLRKSRLSNGGPLNELEEYKLKELHDAYNLIDESLFDQSYDETTDLIQLVYLSDTMIKRLITWCKNIKSFTNLCQDDQIALLKGGCLEMMIMNASINYDLNEDCWVDKHTGNKLTVKILGKANGDLLQAHQNFISDFDQRWRKDLSVNLLLAVIALFSERPHLRHANTVRLEQASYEYLLRRYLESMYPNDMCQATSDYLHLLNKLEDLRELTMKHVNLYLELGPQAIGPLLIEILNLNRAQEISTT